MAGTLKISLAQVNLLVGDVAANAKKILKFSLAARDEQRADLVIFPELTLTGYPPEDLLLRDSLLDWCERALLDLAPLVTGIDVVIGLPIRDSQGLRNSAVVLRGGKVLVQYNKQVLPNYGVFDEMRYFVADHQTCVFDCKGVQVGLTICEDIWQSEPAQATVAAGAELIVNINASPFHQCKQKARLEVLTQRVTETGVPIIYVNNVGGQDELVFDGQSVVITPEGVGLQAPGFEEVLQEVDWPLTQHTDFRPCDEIAEIYRALVLGVRDYVTKNGFPGVLLGLSGGIDSALTLAVAVDALGADSVNVVMMPSRYTADMSRDDAAEEAKTLGVHFDVISIESTFKAFLDLLEPAFEGLPVDSTEENIQARCRGIILMALSNKTGRMLLTTGNKSEMAVGYATLYGDMAGGFAPLKDCSKTLVYSLSRYRNTISPVIPERVIVRPPSAELRDDQQDSDSLPPYDVLDPILEAFIERDESVAEIIAAGFDPDVVARIANMVLRNEYKRRQAPPGVRITQRGFGKDRRYPITSGYFRSF